MMMMETFETLPPLERTCFASQEAGVNDTCLHGVCGEVDLICHCDEGYTNDLSFIRLNSCSVPRGAMTAAAWLVLAWGTLNLCGLLLPVIGKQCWKLMRRYLSRDEEDAPAWMTVPIRRTPFILLLASVVGVTGMGGKVLRQGYVDGYFWFFCLVAIIGIQTYFLLVMSIFLKALYKSAGVASVSERYLAPLFLVNCLAMIGPYLVILSTFVKYANEPALMNRTVTIAYAVSPSNAFITCPFSIVYAMKLDRILKRSEVPGAKLIRMRIRLFIFGVSVFLAPMNLLAAYLVLGLYATGTPYVWVMFCVLLPTMQYTCSVFILVESNANRRSSTSSHSSVFGRALLSSLLCCFRCGQKRNSHGHDNPRRRNRLLLNDEDEDCTENDTSAKQLTPVLGPGWADPAPPLRWASSASKQTFLGSQINLEEAAERYAMERLRKEREIEPEMDPQSLYEETIRRAREDRLSAAIHDL